MDDAEVLERFRADINRGQRGRMQQVADAAGLEIKALRRIYYLLRDRKKVDPRSSTTDGLRKVYGHSAPEAKRAASPKRGKAANALDKLNTESA